MFMGRRGLARPAFLGVSLGGGGWGGIGGGMITFLPMLHHTGNGVSDLSFLVLVSALRLGFRGLVEVLGRRL